MSLFDSFTGPRWQHSNPEVRKEAVAQLQDQEVLLELVKTDPDPTVQAAALCRISSPDVLDALIETLPQALQQQAKNQRLRQLLPGGTDTLATMADEALLLRILSLTDDAELSMAVIARIASDGVRLDLARNHPIAKVRLGAALGIEDIGLLTELMQHSRGHDKTVFRHCKTVVDEHHARQLAAAQQQEKIRHLIDQAEALAGAADLPEYEGRYRSLEQQWQLLEATASEVQKEQFRRELATCAQRVASLAAAQAAEAQAQAGLAAASEVFATLIGELEQIDAAVLLPQDRAAIAQLSERLDDIESRWQVARTITPPSPQQAQASGKYLELWRFMLNTCRQLNDQETRLSKILHEAGEVDAADYQVLQRHIERSGKMLAALPWPDSQRARLPAQIAQLQQALAQLKSQLGALEKDQQKYRERVQTRLEALRAALEQNHSRAADRLLVKARRSLKSLAAKPRQQFEQELQPLAARLQEVHDWQAFAIEPKKVELCARMTALIGSTEEVETLAVKIQSLQDEWKQLGGLPHAHEQALWVEFKAAADEAWKPCKEAFAQKAIVQQQNFDQRMQLVAQLADYEEKMDWPSAAAAAGEAGAGQTAAAPDWRLVQKTLDAARDAFNHIKPVEAKADRKSHRAFRAVCDRIYSHIKAEYERNIARKEQLVSCARELAAADDLQQAMDTCKRLQREWKEIGITPVGVDRRLWKALRSACDAVFARVDEQRAQGTAELDARVKQAESLRDQARALLAAQDDERIGRLGKDLADLQQQFRALELPPGVQQRLAKEFQMLQQQARDLALEIHGRQEQAGWTRLLEKICACAGKFEDEETAAGLWHKSGDLPKGIDAEVLEAFWQQGPSDSVAEQLREACIALEILAGIDSPAADKKARMNYQMRRLAAGMGRRNDQPEPALEERINAFIALRPAAEWAARFCATLEKIRK